MSMTWQGWVTVLSMAWRKALLRGVSLSMSKYDVVAKRGFWELLGICSSCSCSCSSMTIHSELPVSGSSLSWKARWVDSELMARVALKRRSGRGVCVRVRVKRVSREWRESFVGIREAMEVGLETCWAISDFERRRFYLREWRVLQTCFDLEYGLLLHIRHLKKKKNTLFVFGLKVFLLSQNTTISPPSTC